MHVRLATICVMMTIVMLAGCPEQTGERGAQLPAASGTAVAGSSNGTLMQYRLAVWADQQRYVIACPGLGRDPGDSFMVLLDEHKQTSVAMRPPQSPAVIEVISNWFAEGSRMALVCATFTPRGDASKRLLIADATGKVVSDVPLPHSPAPSPTAPSPGVAAVAIASRGNVAALIINYPRADGTVDLAELLVLQLPDGRVLSRASLDRAGARISGTRSFFFARNDSLYLVWDGRLLVMTPSAGQFAVVAEGVSGAIGSPNNRWAVVWRDQPGGYAVERLETEAGSFDLVVEGVPDVVWADVDLSGNHVALAQQSDPFSLTLLHVELDSSQVREETVNVIGRNPGVRWLRPPLLAIADSTQIIAIDMQSRQRTQLWSTGDLD